MQTSSASGPARQPRAPFPSRSYQTAAAAAVGHSLQTRRATLVVSPTATGKTYMQLELARQAVAAGHRVLLMLPAHLVDQTADRARAWGFSVSIEKGRRYAETWSNLVVASADSIGKASRRGRWNIEHFGLLVLDEAYHAVSPTWRSVIDYFTMAKVVGFTATPDRADCQSLLEVFEDCCFEYTIQEGLRDGFLCPIRQRFVHVDGLDFTEIRKEARDLNQGGLNNLLNNADRIRRMAEPTVELVGNRSAIVFCVSVDHAYAFAECLRSLGRNAVAVDADTPDAEREEIEDRFRRMKLQYLVNMGCFTEGFDAPPTAAIVMGRPTTSRALYTQMIGRGLRLHPSKADCMVLDFVGNSGEHCLVHSAHVLDPNIDDTVAQRADRLLQENPDLDVGAAVQLAFDQIQEETRRAQLAARVRQGELLKPEYETQEVDPFMASDSAKVFGLFELPRFPDRWERGTTDAQAEALKRFGIKDPAVLNRREASKLLDVLIGRSRSKLATLRQVRSLVRAGTLPANALRMSFDRAKQGVDELQQNRWERPGHWGPRAEEK